MADVIFFKKKSFDCPRVFIDFRFSSFQFIHIRQVPQRRLRVSDSRERHVLHHGRMSPSRRNIQRILRPRIRSVLSLYVVSLSSTTHLYDLNLFVPKQSHILAANRRTTTILTFHIPLIRPCTMQQAPVSWLSTKCLLTFVNWGKVNCYDFVRKESPGYLCQQIGFLHSGPLSTGNQRQSVQPRPVSRHWRKSHSVHLRH